MKYSIIIPYYNTATTLRRLLISICRAELWKAGEIECIVVDDNSNQNKQEYNSIVQEFKGVTFLKNNSDNKGAGAARNIGITSAIGKWLIFADADDYFTENWDMILETFYFAETDIVYFSPISINESSGLQGNRHVGWCEFITDYLENPTYENELRLRYLSISPCSKMIRRELVNTQHICYEEIPAGNDIMFCRQVAYYAKKIGASKQTIYCISENATSLTSRKDKKLYYSRIDAFIRSYRFLKRRLSSSDLRLSGLNGFENYILSNQFELSKVERFWVLFKMIIAGVKFKYLDEINVTTMMSTIKHYLFSEKL